MARGLNHSRTRKLLALSPEHDFWVHRWAICLFDNCCCASYKLHFRSILTCQDALLAGHFRPITKSQMTRAARNYFWTSAPTKKLLSAFVLVGFGRECSPRADTTRESTRKSHEDKKEQNITAGMKGSRETANRSTSKKLFARLFRATRAHQTAKNSSMLVRVCSAFRCFFLVT